MPSPPGSASGTWPTTSCCRAASATPGWPSGGRSGSPIARPGPAPDRRAARPPGGARAARRGGEPARPARGARRARLAQLGSARPCRHRRAAPGAGAELDSRAIRESGVAVHSLGGWYDGASTRAAVEIHRALGGELVLGPWDHGGYHDVSPHHASGEMRFDIAGEVLGFLDRAFGMPAAVAVAPVRYHVVGAERWRTAPAWPPPGTARLALCLDAVGALSAAPPATGADDHELDLAASSGERTRWTGPAPAGAADVIRRAGPAGVLVHLGAVPRRARDRRRAGLPAHARGRSRPCQPVLLPRRDRAGRVGDVRHRGLLGGGGPWPSTVRVELQPIACRIERGKRASPVVRPGRRRRVRASAGRRIPGPPASRRAGAEPPRAARGARG